MPNAIATVVVDGAADLTFSYSVPDELTGKVAIGSRVSVPLRNRTASGTVILLEDQPGEPSPDGDAAPKKSAFRLKPVRKLLDPEPVLTPELIKLAHWIADYYCTPLETVFRAIIPQAVRKTGPKELTRQTITLAVDPDEARSAAHQLRKRAPKQAAALEELLLRENHSAVLTDLLDESASGRSSTAALAKAGLVTIGDIAIARDPHGADQFIQSHPLELNAGQREALERIIAWTPDSGQPHAFLFRGVTSSGKTEVYLQAIQHCLDHGQGAIVLVPEIALTPQTVERFKSRFAHIQNQVAVLHSHLSEGERHDEWRKVLRRQARIVVGARSAIFAPVERLGLIVVDEEHENTYKQESAPRYHARDLAVVRANLERCPVILGSATPSLESWHNAQTGKYQLLTLESRADEGRLPLVRVVDMRLEGRRTKGAGAFAVLSPKLRMNIEKRLEIGEQVILFLNRRGFARSLQCPDCGKVIECQHCSIAMTYHRGEERLICHLCGFRRIPPKRCPGCNSAGILFAGYGTEKIEGVLKESFPQATIARLDTDSTRKKNSLRDTLNAFRARKIDILLGTQMIAKGLHFPNVTLVGILNADIGLHVPDFRASERTFQLLTQVAGRAGRGGTEGEVLVQTYTPHHPSIQFGRHHDFEGFARQELEFRRSFEFPPYLHMVLITARSVHEQRAEFSLKTISHRLKKCLPAGVKSTDPLPSPIVKMNDQFRFQVLMRGPRSRQMVKPLREVLDELSFPEDVIVTVDVDPYNLS